MHAGVEVCSVQSDVCIFPFDRPFSLWTGIHVSDPTMTFQRIANDGIC